MGFSINNIHCSQMINNNENKEINEIFFLQIEENNEKIKTQPNYCYFDFEQSTHARKITQTVERKNDLI